jgi:hypothetical protein
MEPRFSQWFEINMVAKAVASRPAPVAGDVGVGLTVSMALHVIRPGQSHQASKVWVKRYSGSVEDSVRG